MIPPIPMTGDQGQNELLLSLRQPQAQPQPQRQPQRVVALASSRNRRNPRQTLKQGQSPTITPPFPWATNNRATVHTLKHLIQSNNNIISGDVQCKRCNRQYQIEYDLKAKFLEISRYVKENKYVFHERAPKSWMCPVLPNCQYCGHDNCVKPIMAKKKSINWLFLLLGQMLGCCTLAQLKYFCKHTGNHRTGAKDRVLYLTYLGMCKQLDPTGPYDYERS